MDINTETGRVFCFVATLPPRRKYDSFDRVQALADDLARPGNWSVVTEINERARRICWTTTVPETSVDGVNTIVTDTVCRVGYHGSDTTSPATRKAKLRWARGGDPLSAPIVCPGAW